MPGTATPSHGRAPKVLMNVQEETQTPCSTSEGLSYAGIKGGIILLYWVVLETTQAGVCAQANNATPPALAARLSCGTC